MIEYAYTFSDTEHATEHRRINLKLFYIRLKSKTYKHIAPTYTHFFGFTSKNKGGRWFGNDNKYNYQADKRIEEYQESRRPNLKVIS